MIYISTASNTTIYREAPQPNDRTVLAASKSPRLGQMLVFSLFPLFWPSFRRKVHVYAADANSPTMDTSDAVGWFIVDMRDLAGQRQQERWVKLQGASPAEVLISSSLAMARDRGDLPKQLARDATNPAPSSLSAKAVSDTTEGEGEHHCPPTATADTTPTTTAAPNAAATAATATVTATAPLGAEAEQGSTPQTEEAEVYGCEEGFAVLATSAAEAVSDLEALPVGPGADGEEARTFSLSISVKGAAGLAGLGSGVEVADGVGFWFSYSIFGVVVQTDRFDRLAAPPPGGRPLLEPMLDSFRLRATLKGLCKFLGEAPPLQVRGFDFFFWFRLELQTEL